MVDGVLILGCASSTIRQSPVKRKHTEIWALVPMFGLHPRVAPLISRWFDIHSHDTSNRHRGWWEWAVQHQPRCFLQEPHDDLKKSEAYPIEEMKSRFGPYFTSSISYMLALAIARGYRWIGLYGVDMASGSEYYHQRACCEYLIGLARGSGIQVEIPEGSALLRSPWLYGYDSGRPTTENERIIEEMACWRSEALALRQRVPENMRPRPLPGSEEEIESLQKSSELRLRESATVSP
jgi:hypothetical protein